MRNRHYGAKLVGREFPQTRKEDLQLCRSVVASGPGQQIDDGRSMDAIATVDDPGAYTMQWSAMQRYRRVTQPYSESVCAENNNNYNYFNLRVDPIPEAAKADF